MTDNVKRLKVDLRRQNQLRIDAEAALRVARAALKTTTPVTAPQVVRVPVAPVKLADAMTGTNADKVAALQSIIAVLQARLRAAGLEADV